MKYSEKYDRYVTKGGLIYRYSKKQDKLIICKQTKKDSGYNKITVKVNGIPRQVDVHRIVYEAFNGEIPNGMEIDHIDTNKKNNELSNLKLCTHTENMNNPKTIEALKNNITSKFGIKFKEHFGITNSDDHKLYDKELHWFKRYGKCRWE